MSDVPGPAHRRSAGAPERIEARLTDPSPQLDTPARPGGSRAPASSRRPWALLTAAPLALAVAVLAGVVGGAPLPPDGFAHTAHAVAPAAAAALPGSGAGEEAAPPYRVVGLGDSVPAASGCDCTSFVDLVGRAEGDRTGRPATVTNDAVGGATSSDLEDLTSRPEVRAAVSAADLVIVTVGANDFDADVVTDAACSPSAQLGCYRPALDALGPRVERILDTVADLREGRPGRVVVTGYWNVFLDGAVAQRQGDGYVAASTALTDEVNRSLATAAARHDATYVDLREPFAAAGADDTDLLAPDGDHPSQAGHDLIARAVESAVEPAVEPARG